MNDTKETVHQVQLSRIVTRLSERAAELETVNDTQSPSYP